MRKLFIIVAILLMAASAYAWTNTENGFQNIQDCWVTDMGNMVSGDVVILQTSSPTYWGREVTGTTTADLPIYGVVLGDPSAEDCKAGTWIRVQTHGYCPIVRIADGYLPTAGKSRLVTSTTMFKARYTNVATGNTIALETVTATSGAICKALLSP